MPTPRETILAALHTRLSALPATALRGDVLPERVPAAGLLILRDGEPGEPEVTLSPLRYNYQHRAEIEAVVQGANRDVAFDALCASIGAVIAADRTLSGLCDWTEAEAPQPVDLNRPGFTGDQLVRVRRPYRVYSSLHRRPPLLRPVGCFRWAQAGGGC